MHNFVKKIDEYPIPEIKKCAYILIELKRLYGSAAYNKE
jgi:hypothetical protein